MARQKHNSIYPPSVIENHPTINILRMAAIVELRQAKHQD